MYGDMVVHANPAWLRRLQHGAILLALMHLAIFPIGPFVAISLTSLESSPLVGVLLIGLVLAIVGLGVAGGWLLSTREPWPGRPPHGQILRVILRGVTILTASVAAAGAAGGLVELAAPHSPFAGAWLIALAPPALPLIVLLAIAYLRALTPRMADTSQAAPARHYLWTVASTALLGFLAAFLGSTIGLAAGILGCATFIMLFTLFFWGMGLLVAYSDILRRTLHQTETYRQRTAT